MKISHIALAVVTSSMLISSSLGQSPSTAHLPVIESEGFGAVVSALKDKTRVPPAIPVSLPKKTEVDRFFCTVITLQPNEYEVVIGWTADCGGGNACRVGGLYGKRSPGGRITGTDNYPFDRRRSRRVRLLRGIRGHFVEATCGANCSDSMVFWKRGGYEYMVGLKAEDVATVVELANSAIRNGH